jgi:hypothetical protein
MHHGTAAVIDSHAIIRTCCDGKCRMFLSAIWTAQLIRR